MMVKFTFNNLKELARWLRRQAEDADAKISGLARNLSQKKYFEGQRSVYNNLASMLEADEIEIKGWTQIHDSTVYDIVDKQLEHAKQNRQLHPFEGFTNTPNCRLCGRSRSHPCHNVDLGNAVAEKVENNWEHTATILRQNLLHYRSGELGEREDTKLIANYLQTAFEQGASLNQRPTINVGSIKLSPDEDIETGI